MKPRQQRALAHLIRYNQMVREGEELPNSQPSPPIQVKRQAFYLTHETTMKTENGLEYCPDCGEGEGGLYQNICASFDPAPEVTDS